MGYSKICKGYLSEFSDHISSHHLTDLHASIPLSLNLHLFFPISECERLDKLIKIFQEIQALLYNTLNGMQDIHSVGGGRLFGGGGGGDRRLRQHPHHQALKCPRCDSLNTKFCYYNNYNLSQPRHFCKNCRRYWTKGGVLRNVPVGGGCRKTKRNSKPKSDSEPSAQTQTQSETQREHKTKSHSSSESSSTLTVTNNNNNNNTNVEAVTSVHSSSSVLSSMTDNNTQFFGHARGNNGNNNNNNDPGFDQSATTALLEQGSSDCGIFSEIGSFTNLITSSNEALPFGFGNFLNDNAQQNLEHVQNEQWQQQKEQRKMVSGSIIGGHQELKMQDLTSGLLDQTAQVELSGNNGGFGLLDWQGSCGDHGLFDLPNAVDYASYWSQSTQWTDQDHPSLYLP